MKLNNIVTVCLFFSATMSFANEKGNGGLGIVCRNTDHSIRSAELLDIVEGREFYRLGLGMSDKESVDANVNAALLRLAGTPEYLHAVRTRLDYIRANIDKTGKGKKLVFTNDYGPIHIVDLDEECDFYQIANYSDDGRVHLDEKIYDSMNTVNQAALLVHEAIYSEERSKGAQDSESARNIVTHLFSDQNGSWNALTSTREGVLEYNLMISEFSKKAFTRVPGSPGKNGAVVRMFTEDGALKLAVSNDDFFLAYLDLKCSKNGYCEEIRTETVRCPIDYDPSFYTSIQLIQNGPNGKEVQLTDLAGTVTSYSEMK